MRNILLIDDEPLIVEFLQEVLEENDKVYTAANAAEAWTLFKSIDFSVVISDNNLRNGELGINIVNEMKAIKPETKYALISGDIEFIDRTTTHQTFAKPFDIQKIEDFAIDNCKVA